MKTYGTIKFSTVDAPSPIAGICESFTYKTADQVYEIMGEEDLVGIVLHGRKGDISFSSTPEGSVAALGVRAGGELSIAGVSGGKVIVTTSSAKWSRGQPLTMDAQASHFPSLAATAEGTIALGTFTLARGSGGPLVLPTDKVWFGTQGITSPLAGIVQSASISETVQLQEEEDGDGNITALAVFGYKATGQIEVLTAAALPDLGTELDIFGGFRITSAEYKWTKGQMRSVMIDGILIPGVTD
jgi:hypothetical protein